MTTQLTFNNNSSAASHHTSPAICYRSTLVTSAGLWLGDSPFRFSLPLLLTHMFLFVSTSQATHTFLRLLSQPLMVSQIVAGMIYGPTFIGRDQSFTKTLFPGGSKMYLDTIAGVSLMLFLFMIGVKTDLSMIRKSGKKAVAIGFVGTLIPFGLLALIGHLVEIHTNESKATNRFLFELASTWSRTSYLVLSCILDELNLLNSKMGRIAMAGTLIEDVVSTIVSSVITAIDIGIQASTPLMGLGSFFSFMLFLGFIVFVARPLAMWMIRKTPEGELLDESYFLTIIVIAFGCGFVGEVIGQHATTGCFLLGLALPGGPPLGSTLDEKLSSLIVHVGIPVFMAMAGNRADLTSLPAAPELLFLLMCVVISAVGKMIGVLLPCIYCKMPFRDALTLGLMLNCKGIFEIYMLNNWIDGQLVDQQTYSVIVLTVLLFSGVSAPLVKALYKPSMRYLAYKRRTIQHAKPDSELRLLVVVRSEDNVDPVVRLIDSSQFVRDTPVCVYLLHVLPLIGQTAAMLIPYKRHKPTDSDAIVNVFKYLERRNKDTLVVQPFISVSPLATMHDDVCSLALDKKVPIMRIGGNCSIKIERLPNVQQNLLLLATAEDPLPSCKPTAVYLLPHEDPQASLVLLPFHRQMAIDGTLESTSHGFRAMNTNAFDYAPCSVTVLIDHGLWGRSTSTPGTVLSSRPAEHICMFFIGGPDDRESLALASRMVGDSANSLTVIRFQPPKEWRNYSLDDKTDDEVVNEFRLQNAQRKNVAYHEQIVKDGGETSAFIRSMKDFSMFIVGRRHGIESPTTAGLSMWSEYPELGVIGDMLASSDFGNWVTTLVVQQQTRVGSSDQGGVKCYFGLGGGCCYLPTRTVQQDHKDG